MLDFLCVWGDNLTMRTTKFEDGEFAEVMANLEIVLDTGKQKYGKRTAVKKAMAYLNFKLMHDPSYWVGANEKAKVQEVR